ncbi:MAG: acyl--CoA ligase [Clostridia bacterium]|nr:acyl--CoA ligase [Clostridia bacterium]
MQKTELTGYPSIDKPWMNFYSAETIEQPLPECTIYEYITQANSQNLEKVAINYYGTNITYGELFNRISLVAGALENLGVKKGTIVTICMINSPEVISLIFALNKIGAIANLIYGVSTEKEVINYIKNTKSTIVFTLDVFQGKFLNSFDLLGLEKLIIIKTSLSMNPDYKKTKEVLSGIPDIELPKTSDTIILWSDFMKSAKHTDTLVREPHNAAIITYTGGTTGGSKGVLQSSFGIISNIYQYRLLNIRLDRKNSWLMVLPLFIGFGVFSLLIPLSIGMTVIIRIPMTDSISDLCKEFKPNHIMYSPAFWEILANSDEDIDLEYLIEPMAGGDILYPSVEEKINRFLNSHGCKYKIMNGYGMSELGPGISINCSKAYEFNSVGVPFVKNTVSAFDIETGIELKYNNIGEICVSSPSIMMGYYNDLKETNLIIKEHDDGKLWVHTGDLGYISEKGFIHISGRLKRYILHFSDGVAKKIFSLDIERVINQYPLIEKCAVVPVSDLRTNQSPVAFIISKKGVDEKELIERIRKFAEMNLEPEYCPIRYHIVKEFPLTKVGKINYLDLEKTAECLNRL